MSKFDICVIGAGPGGFSAAVRGWDFGKRVCLIERSQLGGAGVHNGALSSKTLWELSCDYRIAIRRDRGYDAQHVQLDYSRVTDCVRVAVGEKTDQLQRQLAYLARPQPGSAGTITLMRGAARFVDAHTVLVESSSGDTTIEADSFVIATGSRPRMIESIPIDGRIIMTSDHIMQLDRFPRSLVIVGAGVVGCEMATIFANYGQTKVYLIDRADRILPFEDEDISRLCSANLEARGVTIHQLASLVKIGVVDGGVDYTIEQPMGGHETIHVERALISIGRLPNTEGLDLEETGVRTTPRGHIVSDDTQTTAGHIHAVGDVTYDVALASVAELEARHAVARICGQKPPPLTYENLSTIMFLDPEVAAIGLNEQSAREKRVAYRVAVYGYGLVNRPIAMRATEGFIKLMVTDADEMQILGVRALGVHASTTIEAVSLMIQQKRSVCDLAELFHPHPAVPEGLQECVRMLMGTSVYKPQVFPSLLRLSRVSHE